MKKNIALASSIAVNVVLVAALIWVCVDSRNRNFTLLADVTTAEVRLQEHFLAEIESGDATRVEALKQMLRRNIQTGRSIAAGWRAAAE